MDESPSSADDGHPSPKDRQDGSGLRRGAGLLLASQWVRFIAQLTTTLLLARILVPDDFGTAALVTMVVGFGYLLGESGLSAAAIQAADLTDRQASNLLWTNVAVGGVLAGIAYGLSGPLGSFSGDAHVTESLRVACWALPLQAAYSQIAAQRTRALQFSRIAIAEVTAQMAGLALAITLALSGFGHWSLVLQLVAVAAVQLLCIVLGALPWRLYLPSRAPMGRLYRFGFDTLGLQALTYGSNNMDTFAGSRFWATADLGIYSRAIQLFRQPLQLLLTPLTKVALPILSRRQADVTWLNHVLVRAQRLIASTLGIVFAVLLISAEEIIYLALGPGWDPVVQPFQILVIGGIFQCAGYVYYWAFLVRAKTGVQLRASILSRSLQIVLICVAAPFGPVWVAAAVSAGLLLHWILLSTLPLRRTGLDVPALVRALLLPMAIHVALCSAGILVHRHLIRFLASDFLIILGVTLFYCTAFAIVATLSGTLRQDFRSIFAR